MTPNELKLALRADALRYAEARSIPIDTSHASALLFAEVKDNFHPKSFHQIAGNTAWLERINKAHSQVEGFLEMQSSNSSDALLMNVFCHPRIGTWKGVRDILQVSTISPVFGMKAMVAKKSGVGDATEIDMQVGDVFVEAKLAETDFTHKDAATVEAYSELERLFHADCLQRKGSAYDNYQIIRNLLAAAQHQRRHILICDERRPDLLRRYMETVACLRDARLRTRCGVVFWQEIRKACGADLSQFLSEKYGMC
jgi:hypothetical protein